MTRSPTHVLVLALRALAALAASGCFADAEPVPDEGSTSGGGSDEGAGTSTTSSTTSTASSSTSEGSTSDAGDESTETTGAASPDMGAPELDPPRCWDAPGIYTCGGDDLCLWSDDDMSGDGDYSESNVCVKGCVLVDPPPGWTCAEGLTCAPLSGGNYGGCVIGCDVRPCPDGMLCRVWSTNGVDYSVCMWPGGVTSSHRD